MAEDPVPARKRKPARPAAKRKKVAAARSASTLTRVQILKSAAHAFKQLGYHGATLEQIAAALKMQKGNLYYYFRSKEDILFACHQYSVDRLLDVLDTVERADLHPEQKLHRLLVSFIHTILDDLHGTALFLDIKVLGPKYLRQAIARRDEFDRGLRRVIQQGVDWGVFDAKVDPKLLSFAIMPVTSGQINDSPVIISGW